MRTLLLIILGIVSSTTLASCDVTIDMWQWWVMLACAISYLLIGCFLV
jgi:hypothetical protein